MRRGLGADLLDPEGVSQSVFVHLLMYPIPSKVEAQFWLKDVVRRETQEAVRNAGELLRSQSIETMAENGIVIPAPEPTHQDQRMSRKLARKLERRKVALQELVQRLTPALRRVASFQLFDGGLAMTAAGVGSQLKMRPNTVTQNWMRARVELQEMIIKSGMFRVRRKSVDK